MRPWVPSLMARMKSGWRDRLDVAGALQRRFLGVDRSRGVDGEHQLEVDGSASALVATGAA